MKVTKLVAWPHVMVENKSGSNVQPKGPNTKENAVRCKANPNKMNRPSSSTKKLDKNEHDAVKSPDSKCCVMLADVVEDLAFGLAIDVVISSTDDLADAFKTEDAAADDGCQDVGASDDSVAAEDTALVDGDAVAAVSNAAAVVAVSKEC